MGFKLFTLFSYIGHILFTIYIYIYIYMCVCVCVCVHMLLSHYYFTLLRVFLTSIS